MNEQPARSSEAEQAPVLIDPASLSPETLQAILESFVLREGTDYGVHEISLEQKILNLRKKVARQDIVLVFDPNTESLTFLTKTEWFKMQNRFDDGPVSEV